MADALSVPFIVSWPLPITLAALFLTGKSFSGAFPSNSRLDIREVKTESL